MPRTHVQSGLARAIVRFRESALFALLAGVLASTIGTTLVSVAAAHARPGAARRWSGEERAVLRSLTLASLGPLPADPSNRYAGDPRAAALGRELFSTHV